MTRYFVEYRRLCPFTKEIKEWKNYYTSDNKMSAMEIYCQHLTPHPEEECRLISLTAEPMVYFEFTPPSSEQEEAA